MKAHRLILLLSFVFVIAFVTNNVVAKEPMSKIPTGYEISKLLQSDVQDPKGEYLGTITDFVVDSRGRIEFAILRKSDSTTGDSRYIAVPFAALSYAPSTQRFILNTTSERLTSAPSFDQNKAMTNPEFAEDVYRYFGLEPYWTEQGHEKWFRSDQDPFDLMG
ncbi:MAG: PRC-barrel domain-containing protein [Thermodesulfobacteriota bacterium]